MRTLNRVRFPISLLEKATRVLIGLLPLLAGACANPRPPPGGPPDVIPPRVVHTTPAADSVGVGTQTRIRIRFSESMDRRSVTRAIFVSPRFSTDPDFRWRGRELEIRPREGLREDRTYVVAVGAASSDESFNRMEASYSFAFSTGHRLSGGEIHGGVLVRDGKRGQVYVWAYDLAGVGDPDPAAASPAYVTQPGDDGTYRFVRLGAGRYRIFAFRDGDRDQAYTHGEPLAVPPGDISLLSGDSRVQLGLLKMAVRDSVPPRFVSARTPDRRRLSLRFDEPVDLPSPPRISDSDGFLEVEAVYPDARDSSRVWLVTSPQKAEMEYRVELGGIADRFGNAIAPGEVATVRGEGQPDRRAPDPVRVDPDVGARHISQNAELRIDFNEAMAPATNPEFWVISDSTDAPAGRFSWPRLNRLAFRPDEAWVAGENYVLKAPASKLSDVSGNPGEGEIVFRFTVASPRDQGAVSGAVVSSDTPIMVQAQSLSGPERTHAVTVAPGDSTYFLDALPPGRYRVLAFGDIDGNRTWTPGVARPFAPAEPMSSLHDTIEVAPRWETAAEERLHIQAWVESGLTREK